MTNLISVCGMKWNIEKLQSFYNHYMTLGVHQFLIILHQCKELPLDKPNIKYFHWDEEFSEIKKIKYEHMILEKECKPEDWVIYADPDEFHEPRYSYDNYRRLSQYEWLGGELVDVATDEFLAKFGHNIITMDFTKKCGAWDKKICACRANQKLDVGHHMFYGEKYDPNLKVDVMILHYKWDQHILEKIEQQMTYKDPQLKYWQGELLRAKKLIEESMQ